MEIIWMYSADKIGQTYEDLCLGQFTFIQTDIKSIYTTQNVFKMQDNNET